ncbi:MAG: hypothetical protein WDW36_003196 [Sanguina aurantia]
MLTAARFPNGQADPTARDSEPVDDPVRPSPVPCSPNPQTAAASATATQQQEREIAALQRRLATAQRAPPTESNPPLLSQPPLDSNTLSHPASLPLPLPHSRPHPPDHAHPRRDGASVAAGQDSGGAAEGAAAAAADVVLLAAALGVAESSALEQAQRHAVAVAALESHVSELQDALEAASWEAMRAEARCEELQLDSSVATASAAAIAQQLAGPTITGLQRRLQQQQQELQEMAAAAAAMEAQLDRGGAEVGRLQRCMESDSQQAWQAWDSMISQLQEQVAHGGRDGSSARVLLGAPGDAEGQLTELDLRVAAFEGSSVTSLRLQGPDPVQQSGVAEALLQRLLQEHRASLAAADGVGADALLRAAEAEGSLSVLQLAVQRQQGERRAEVQALERRHRAALAVLEEEHTQRGQRVQAAEAAMAVRSRQADVLAAQLNEALRVSEQLRGQATEHAALQRQLDEAEGELLSSRAALHASSMALEEGGISSTTHTLPSPPWLVSGSRAAQALPEQQLQTLLSPAALTNPGPPQLHGSGALTSSSAVAVLTEQREELVEELERAQAQSAGMGCSLQEQHALVGMLRRQVTHLQEQADTSGHAAAVTQAADALTLAHADVTDLTNTVALLRRDASLALAASQASLAAAGRDAARLSAQLTTATAAAAAALTDTASARAETRAAACQAAAAFQAQAQQGEARSAAQSQAALALDATVQQGEAREVELHQQLQELRRKQATQEEQLDKLEGLEAATLPSLQAEVRQAREGHRTAQQQLALAQQQLTAARLQASDAQQRLTLSQGELADSRLGCADARSQLALLHAQLAESHLGCTNWQQQLSESQLQLAESQLQLAESQLQLADSKQQVTASHQQLTEAQQQLEGTQQQLDDTQRRLATSQGLVSDLNRASAALHQEAAELRRRIEQQHAAQTGSAAAQHAAATSLIAHLEGSLEQQRCSMKQQHLLLAHATEQLGALAEECQQQRTELARQQLLLAEATEHSHNAGRECGTLAGQVSEARRAATWWEGEAEFLRRRVEDTVAELAEVRMRGAAQRQGSERHAMSVTARSSSRGGDSGGQLGTGGTVCHSAGAPTRGLGGSHTGLDSLDSLDSGNAGVSEGDSGAAVMVHHTQSRHRPQHVDRHPPMLQRPADVRDDTSEIHSGGSSCSGDAPPAADSVDEGGGLSQLTLDREAPSRDAKRAPASAVSGVSGATAVSLPRSETAVAVATVSGADHPAAERALALQVAGLGRSVLLLSEVGRSVAAFLTGDRGDGQGDDGVSTVAQQGLHDAAASQLLPPAVALSSLRASCDATAEALHRGLECALLGQQDPNRLGGRATVGLPPGQFDSAAVDDEREEALVRHLQEQQRKMVRVLRKLSREGPRGVVGQLEGLRQENTGLSIRYNAAQLAHQQCQRALGVLVDENRGMAALVKQLQASAPARQHIHAFASPDPVRRCLSELSDV